MSRCRECGSEYEKKAPNQKFCTSCSFYCRYRNGRIYQKLTEAEVKFHALADASGNPRVWRAGEYDQDFLKALIPSWI